MGIGIPEDPFKIPEEEEVSDVPYVFKEEKRPVSRLNLPSFIEFLWKIGQQVHIEEALAASAEVFQVPKGHTLFVSSVELNFRIPATGFNGSQAASVDYRISGQTKTFSNMELHLHITESRSNVNSQTFNPPLIIKEEARLNLNGSAGVIRLVLVGFLVPNGLITNF